jgi:hypothetical protein
VCSSPAGDTLDRICHQLLTLFIFFAPMVATIYLYVAIDTKLITGFLVRQANVSPTELTRIACYFVTM